MLTENVLHQTLKQILKLVSTDRPNRNFFVHQSPNRQRSAAGQTRLQSNDASFEAHRPPVLVLTRCYTQPRIVWWRCLKSMGSSFLAENKVVSIAVFAVVYTSRPSWRSAVWISHTLFINTFKIIEIVCTNLFCRIFLNSLLTL